MSSSTARSVLEAFLHALSRLDLDALLDGFDEQATAFLPAEHLPTRLQGTTAIGNALAAVLARVRATGATSIPLAAQDVHIQQWGDTAVATFHLRGEHLSRRTFVLQCQAGQWRIVHLHASNAPLDE
jgi:ketosteroid isomerase-like protein